MNILELDSYRLGDAVKFNDQLNPKLWGSDEHLHPQIREQLLRIAEDFAEFLGVSNFEIKDITISGSNAAYTYTANSDIDLHLVVDLPKADASEVYRELFDAKKYQYNDQHNITIGGYDVELYVQNANQPHISQGIYSVLNNDWVSVPRRARPTVDDISTRSKYETLSQQIDQAIESKDYEMITALVNKIKKMRQTGLEQHGEFGPENIAFKMLRSQGAIERLYAARNAAKDELLSLDERRRKKKGSSKKRWGYFGGYWYPGTGYAGQDTPAAQAADGGGDGGAESIREDAGQTDEQILKDFIQFCVSELEIKQMPRVRLRKDPEWPKRHRTFGRYSDDAQQLEVAWGNRHIMDVLRTVAHELTHKRQHEREAVPADAGETGSEYENEANARAGVLMRDWARLHPEHFEAGQVDELEESASGYIPTKAQAKDPRFSMALTVDIKPGQVGKEANKLKLRTNRQGHPQIAQANGLFEKLSLELAQFKKSPIAESAEVLDEVKMSPSALQRWAKSPEAQGIRAGFEAELIFRDTANGGDSDYEMEPDYDMDERARSISQIIDFFSNGEYGGLSDRQQGRLQDELDETYMEWYDEQMRQDFGNEAEDLIRKVLVDEGDWDLDNEIQKQLALLDLTDDEINDIVNAGERAPKFTSTKEQQTYAEENPLYDKYMDAQSEAEDLLDALVEDEVRKQGANWDAALDDFRDNYQIDDDSGFFDDTGLRWMSDIANNYDLDWPYMTGGGGNDGSRDWDEIGDSLNTAIDMPVKVSSNYHSTPRKEGLWIVEPDTSLQPDDSEDFGLEIVSPPLPLDQALEKLQQVTDWANSSEGNAYTNSSTGLHMGVSVPFKGGDVDYLKLILFLGDEYVLQRFGREANTYTKSAMSKFRENIKGGRADPMGAIKLMQHGLLELAYKEIQKGVGEGKYTSAHIQKGYIEFRSAGGDWLAEENADPAVLQNTMLRFARAMSLAANASEERREYAKKLYKLVAPEGDSQLALFSQYAAGELTAEQLKKKWAEKTIGTEKKMNQRWKLYQKFNGTWTAVPGAEWNGYTEDQVKNAVWSKYGREALDSGEYQLVNMGEQDWEVYDVNSGETLEIVKGKSKGEVADAVFDKYANAGVGFNVRPYVDPATMTPRAKLAKRITTKKQEPEQLTQATNERGVPYWEIFERETGHVVHTFLADTQADAWEDTKNWLAGMNAEQPNLFSMRPKMNAGTPVKAPKEPAVQDTDINVAQNFDQPQDATEVRRNWEFVDRITGQVVHSMTNASYNQANAVQTNLEQQNPAADIYLRSVERSN
jgi:hypothetical protein